MAIKATLGHVIKGDKILLKFATRGISKGKWNAPGGKFDKGEPPEQCIIRETYEETGLRIRKPFYHGKLYFFLDGRKKLTVEGWLFSARKFSGKPHSTEEGEVRWFSTSSIPYDRMWDDDKYWMNLMLAGIRFDSYFYYDRTNTKVVRSVIKLKN